MIEISPNLDFSDWLNAMFIAVDYKKTISQNDMLQKGMDISKDQSYMLWDIDKEQLKKTLFPIGNMTKEEVRKYAIKHNLETANRAESQDLCFVLGDDYNQFLYEIVPDKMANISMDYDPNIRKKPIFNLGSNIPIAKNLTASLGLGYDPNLQKGKFNPSAKISYRKNFWD